MFLPVSLHGETCSHIRMAFNFPSAILQVQNKDSLKRIKESCYIW